MTKSRLEDLLINAIEWSLNVGDQHTSDLLKAIGITSKELEYIGYEVENATDLHNMIKERY